MASSIGRTLFEVLKSVIWIERGGPRVFTNVSKFGSDTRSSNNLLTGKTFKETPNSLLGPALREF